jgi:hypothetical protein
MEMGLSDGVANHIIPGKGDTLGRVTVQAIGGVDRVNRHYVVDENGERVAILLDIEEYERIVAQHHAPAPAPADERPSDDQDLDPEEAERRITAFVTSAEELPGPPVAELADRVAELMRATWKDLEAIISGNPHNKVLAVELLLSQRARGLQAEDPEQWRLHAATSLLSGIAIGNADKRAER